MLNYASHARTTLVSCAALALAACGSEGRYRIASVGDVPASTADAGNGGGSSGTDTVSTGGSGSTAGSGSTQTAGTVPIASPMLVSAGNTIIGAAGRHNALAGRVNGIAPGAAPVTGTVTAVLRKTGQTLVDVGGGRSVILNRAAGKLGEVVAIDLGSRRVVSASSGSSLLGVGVASASPPSGSLAGVNVASGGSPAGSVTRTATGAVATVTGASGSASTGLVPVATPAHVGGLAVGTGLIAAGSTTVASPGTTTSASGLLGIGGLVRGKGK